MKRSQESKMGSSGLDRQVDIQGFVFAKGEALSRRAVAAARGTSLAAHADQNSSQPRIQRINHKARDGIEKCSR